MNSDVALYWVQQSLETTIMVVGPLLGAALLVGLFVSMFQAVTSMQEMTLSFIPKLLALGLALLLLAPWMLRILTDFTMNAFTAIPSVSQ
ncbi:MAG: flagellar biosynthesis protein FliQ [Bacteroidetes bacterium]|jgi:flagellar biosynthetic protein FliQ|nr:flagellar biosynthesis protein FliQ [Bacteroidota bacterium]